MTGPYSPFDNDRLALLDRMGRLLKGAQDQEAVLRLSARAVVPGFAELAIIFAQDSGGGECLVAAHVQPDKEEEILTRVRNLLPAIRRVADVDLSRHREFRWIPQMNQISLRFLLNEPELLELLFSLQLRSLIVVPLRAEGRMLGAMALGRTRQTGFAATDLALAQVLVRRIASAVQTVRMYEQSLDEQSRRARLEAAVQKWVRVFDLAGWGAAIVDGSDYRIEAVNPAFASLHGYGDPAALIGRRYHDLLLSSPTDEPDGWAATAAAPHQPYESAHVRLDGTAFPVLTDVTALHMAEGVTSYVVTVQDVTELKRTEERLRRAQRLESVGRLAGGVAHEVNNMMTIILGFSDLLARGGGVAPDRQGDIDEIRKAASRASKITQQLLAFSRQQILQLNNLSLNDAVTGLEPMLRLLLPANIELETGLAPLPPIVQADRAQLEQVIINLVFNARDAMAEGGLLRVTTDSRRLEEEDGRRRIGIPIPSGQYALLSVVDTGHGMDQSTLAQVFEPFFTTKPVGTGTGLGLATVYGIVKQSGGYVWVESSPGVGTTVTVCLPQLVHGAELAPEPGAHRRAVGCCSGTLLVVEDEEGVLQLTHRVLEQQGHRIVEARDGDEALARLDEFGAELDLVLSDVIVPNIGTAELEQRIRELRPDLPIIYMSGYSRDEIAERGLIHPDQAFLQKPFTAAELTELVCRELEAASEARGEEVTS